MLTAQDFKGVYGILPTPAKEGQTAGTPPTRSISTKPRG